MSSYIHVFARKNETFIELLCYCRSSELYQVLHQYAPYGKIAQLTNSQMSQVKTKLLQRLADIQQYNDEDKALIAQVGSWSNTTDEKFEAINELQRNIAERTEETDELDAAVHILNFLLNVEAELYIGEECGSDVTVEYIVVPQS